MQLNCFTSAERMVTLPAGFEQQVEKVLMCGFQSVRYVFQCYCCPNSSSCNSPNHGLQHPLKPQSTAGSIVVTRCKDLYVLTGQQ